MDGRYEALVARIREMRDRHADAQSMFRPHGADWRHHGDIISVLDELLDVRAGSRRPWDIDAIVDYLRRGYDMHAVRTAGGIALPGGLSVPVTIEDDVLLVGPIVAPDVTYPATVYAWPATEKGVADGVSRLWHAAAVRTPPAAPALWPPSTIGAPQDPDDLAVAYGAAIKKAGGVPKIELATCAGKVLGIVVYDSACRGLPPRKFDVQPLDVEERMQKLIVQQLQQEVERRQLT